MIILAKETVRCKIDEIMKHTIICLLLLVGGLYNLKAQDKIVLRNGRTIEVKVQRTLDSRVEYTYPGETSVYERPKSAISYILYEDGRREICDENLRVSERSSSDRASSSGRESTNRTTSSSARTNRLSNDDEIFWQDIKTTFSESEVKNMTRLRRISATSNLSYKDAIQQLKKNAAAIGGTMILVMDEDDSNNDIEVMGIAYRDEEMDYVPRSTSDRNRVSEESSSNERRRRIAQQMEGYNNNSDLEYEDNSSRNSARNSSSSSRDNNRQQTRQAPAQNEVSPDAVHLMNGRVINGTIEEFEPDDFVSIRTQAGRVYEYSMDDVKRVSRGTNRSSGNNRSSSQGSSRYNNNDRQSNNNRTSSSRHNDNNYYDDDVTGYKGTFDAGYNLTFGGEKGIMEFSTSHGYQINTNLFVGVGAGLHMYNARDPLLKSNMGKTAYPQYANGSTGISTAEGTLYPHSYSRAMDSSFMMLPIFADIRGYLPMSSPITPFASLKVGYTFNLSDGFGGAGIYMAPSVGAKYNLTHKIGITLSVGYTFQGLGESGQVTKDGTTTIKGGYGYYTYKDEKKELFKTTTAQGVHIKLGVEF